MPILYHHIAVWDLFSDSKAVARDAGTVGDYFDAAPGRGKCRVRVSASWVPIEGNRQRLKWNVRLISTRLPVVAGTFNRLSFGVSRGAMRHWKDSWSLSALGIGNDAKMMFGVGRCSEAVQVLTIDCCNPSSCCFQLCCILDKHSQVSLKVKHYISANNLTSRIRKVQLLSMISRLSPHWFRVPFLRSQSWKRPLQSLRRHGTLVQKCLRPISVPIAVLRARGCLLNPMAT